MGRDKRKENNAPDDLQTAKLNITKKSWKEGIG
jgi:hypothetical protein